MHGGTEDHDGSFSAAAEDRILICIRMPAKVVSLLVDDLKLEPSVLELDRGVYSRRTARSRADHLRVAFAFATRCFEAVAVASVTTRSVLRM